MTLYLFPIPKAMKLLTNLIFFAFATASVAQTIPNFSLVNAVDGKSISLNNYASHKGVVIIFTSNDCPFDQYYLERLIELSATYSSKVPVLLVNSNRDDKETVIAMKNYANRNNLTMPYLADKDQHVLNQFNARKSPEAFLLKNSSGKFSIVYKGALDDNAQTASEVRNAHLKTAIDNLLNGETISESDVRPVGCSIRRN